MAVRIRLKRLGRKHRAYFRICVMDARTPRDGKAIEEVGTYDPMVPETDKRCTMKSERIDYWLSVGAQPTERVARLIEKYKGKVPEVRVDAPAQRVVPPPMPPKRTPRPQPQPAAEAAPVPAETPAEQPTAAEQAPTPEAGQGTES